MTKKGQKVCWECLHIALDVLLAEGQPLDAALLFAMNSLGGLNCTGLIYLKLTLARVVMHHELSSDFRQVLI